MPDGKNKVEVFKEQSHYLRGHIADELRAETTHFAEAEKQVLKFHGIYQQEDRDQRKQQESYIFMVRCKLPGGRLTADQYLVLDDLADCYGNGTLRITSRQGMQFHGVLKGDLQTLLHAINDSLVTTLGACGDVVRNVMCCPVPPVDPVRAELHATARRISDHMTPRTEAYHEIWLNGEKVYDGQAAAPPDEEPIYGKTYLPRKFKIGVAHSGDNCIDVYTHDLGLVGIAAADRLVGFNVLVGGGQGMTHNKPDTFPRLADPLAFITPEQVLPLVEQIVCVQRDYGDRTNRKHARLKYLIHEWGVARFREELERRLGYRLKPFASMPPFKLDLHLGWHAQGDGQWYLGIPVENGRIRDASTLRLRTGLRDIIRTFRPNLHLTANHDILLTDLAPQHRAGIDALLRQYGIARETELSNVQLYSLACPAIPTCGLALAEAERALPAVVDRLEAEIARLGLGDEQFSVRMTGCPNGCARPYMADLGFVGRTLNKYSIFVGGRLDGTRLNQLYRDLVPVDELVDAVLPLFMFYKDSHKPGEAFGDFCVRVGVGALRAFAAAYQKEGAYA